MKNILPSLLKFKNKTFTLFLFLTCCLLLNAFTNKIDFPFLNNFLAIDATISVDDNNVCIEETTIITFEGSGGTAPYTFTYQINNGGELSTVSNNEGKATVEFSNPAAANYIFDLIKVSDTSSDPEQVITDQNITITVNPLPISEFTFNDNACSGDTVQFNATETGTAPFTYLWDFDDGNSSTEKNPTHIYDSELGCGTSFFDVKLVVTDVNGCTGTRIQRVTILQKPDIDFGDSSGNEFSNCSNSPSPNNPNYQINLLNLSNDKSCVETYEIEWGDGNSLSIKAEDFDSSLDYEYTQTGVFNLKIKAIASNGCENEKTYQIKNVSTPGGGLEADGNTADLCPTNPALKFRITNFEENSDDSIYIVDFGDGTTPETYSHSEVSDGLNLSHQYKTSSCNQPNNEFIATLTIKNACTSRNWTVDSITVLSESEAEFDAPDKSCVNQTINFINQSIIGDKIDCDGKQVSFLWDFGDGSTANNFLTNLLENQSHIYTSPGTYTITLKLQGKCIGKDTFTKQICIEPEITPTFSIDKEEGCIQLAVKTTNTTDLSELCSAPSYNWSIAYAEDNCGNVSDWEFTKGTATSENPEFLFKNPGKYTITQRITTGCGTVTSTKDIEVKKPPTVTINPIQDFCGTATIAPIATVENCTSDTTGITYNWTFIGGNPSNNNTLNPGNIEYTTPGVYTVTLEVTSECGISNTATQTFEIFEKPVISNTDTTQEICSGQNTSEIILTTNNTNTTFSWSAVSSGNISGFITNGTTSTIPSQALINTGNNPETVTYTVIPKLGSCEGEALEFTITLNPSPIITIQPTPSEVCLNGVATTLEVAHENGTGTPTYQWFYNDSNSNNNKIDGASNATYDPPTDTVGEKFYYAEISFESGGGCDKITSDIASVKVVEQLTVNPIAAPQALCVGGTADELKVTFTGGTGNPSYQWFKNSTKSNTDGEKINGETNSTYTPPTFNNAETVYYYVQITLDGNGCNTDTSEVFEINVLLDPVIDSQPIASEILCQNAAPTDLSVTASGGSTSALSYQWFLNTNNNNTGGTQISGATSSTYTPETSTVGTFYYYVRVSQPESDCAVVSEVSALTINKGPNFKTQPTPSEICLNGVATTLEVAHENGTGDPTYKWFSSDIDSYSNGVEIPDENNSTYDPPTDAVGEQFYYAEISFESGGGCDKITSDIASVKVVEQLTVNPIAAPQALCVGGTADELKVTFTGGTGSPSYQWFKNTSNSKTGGEQINGETNSTYTPPTFNNADTVYYYAEITLDGNGCNTDTSEVFEINVLLDPVIDSQPIASEILCQNAAPTDLSVTASGGSTSALSYQWFLNTNNNNTGGTQISGATSSTYTPETSTVGTFYYYVRVSQPESDCAVVSEVSVLTINKGPNFKTQPTPSEICLNGVATTLEVAYEDGTGDPTYQWFYNDSNSNNNKIDGASNATYDPPTDTVGEQFYYAEISFEAGGGCDKITSNIASVKVVEQLTVNPIAAPQTLCVGGTADELKVTFTGGTGSPSYQWFKNTSNSKTGGEQINGETNSTYTPPTFNNADTVYYYAEITLDGNGCNTDTSEVFEINVLLDPVIDPQPNTSEILCQNATPTDLSVTASGGSTPTLPYQYQWFLNKENNTTDGTEILNATASTYTPDTDEVGTFYYYVRVSQPESDCFVVSEVFVLTINKGPNFKTQPTPSEICLNGVATTLEVAHENGTGDPTYKWFSSDIDSYSNGVEIPDENNSTYDPPTDTVGEQFYYAEISFEGGGGCDKITSNIASVKVNGIPVISNAEITMYSEATFTFEPNSIASNTVPAGTQYTWFSPTYSPAGSILGASAETTPQNTISQTLENTGTSPIVVSYTVTPATESCVGNPFTLEVTVNPNISSNAVVTNITCFETNDGAISTNIQGGVPSSTGNPYLISWSGPNGFSSTDASISNLEMGVYILRIEDSSGFFISEEWTVSQPDLLSISKDLVQDISCFQGNDGSIALTISGGTEPYTYNWSTTNGSGIIAGTKNQNTLTAGTYSLEIVDANNCIAQETFVLTEPNGLNITTTAKQDILCFGDATGAISIEVTGGTQIEVSPGVFDYNYNWSGPAGYISSSKNINNLIAGTYTVAVTDNLGCTTSTEIIVNESPEIIINYTTTDVTCYGETDGALEVTVSGGAKPYQISWSNFGNGFSQSTLSADTYIATITDANRCSKEVAITINQPLFFIEPEIQPITCNNANDGSINLNLTGGIAPITLSWSDDPSAGVQRNNLAAGTYTVTIVDSDPKQCPIEETFVLTNPPAIAVSSIVTDAIDCTIANSGSIDLTVTGGSEPIEFSWSNGETSEDLENIVAGNYNVTITDATGCTVNRQFSVFRQDPIEIEFIESFITDCETKTVIKKVEAKTSGGFLPHTLSWSAGTVSGTNNEIMTTNQSGSYVLTVTDDNGCIQTKSIFIDDIPTIGDPEFRYSAFALDKYAYLSINDPIQFTNLSTGNFTSLTWDFGDGSLPVNEENPIHTYSAVGNYTVTLSAEYESGCMYTLKRNIDITIGYKLMNPTAFSPNGDGYNEIIKPNFRGFSEIEMNIYNTWGQLVYFEKGTSLKGWDGTIKDSPAENGNYVMVVKGITFYNESITTSTPVTLLK